jgi:hypothetical protein
METTPAANDTGLSLLANAEEHHKKVSPKGKGSAWDAYEAGHALIGAKDVSPSKGWLAALKEQTSISPRSCQRYMLLARVVDAGMIEQPIREMSFTEAYSHASTAAARLVRRTTPAAMTSQAGEATGVSKDAQTKAFNQFRAAARGAIAAGLPYRRLERLLAEVAGTQMVEQTATEHHDLEAPKAA